MLDSPSIHTINLRLKRSVILTCIATILGLTLFIFCNTASASVAHWNAGRIIDDDVMSNSGTMTVSQIQAFLNRKVPSCDTNGQQTSEYGGPDLNHDGRVQRWEWGKSKYNQTKFICLRNYSQGGKSSAQIIYDAARRYTINPQVLLVLLQKEQGLVKDTWPLNIQYRSATGYGCPDSAPCDSDYYGLTNQINWSAKMFRAILNNSPTWYTPYILGQNYIRYNPDTSCGGSNVTIVNRATQALYNYTPYQPNQAALNADMGQTVNCGAYGNINFYRYFSSWFRSPNGGDLVSSDLKITSPIQFSPSNPTPGQAVTTSYTFKNTSDSSITFDRSVLQCRDAKNTNCDSAYGGSVTINAGAEKTFTSNIAPNTGSTYSLIPFFSLNGVWYRFGETASAANTTKMIVPDIRLVTPLTLSPRSPIAGDAPTNLIYFKNYGNAPVTFQNSVLQCRYETSTSCDSPYRGRTTIQPGQTLPFADKVSMAQGGNYRLVPYFMVNSTWYMFNTTSSIENAKTLNVADMRLVGNIISDPANPISGQPFKISYTFKNFGAQSVQFGRSILQCRLNENVNCDPNYQTPNISIAPGEQKTFTIDFGAARAGTYVFKPYFEQNTAWHLFNKGTASTNTLTLSVPKYTADMQLVGDIVVTPTQPIPGQTATASYTVRNNSDKPAYYQRSILQCRFNTRTNCDPDYNTAGIVIQPGEQRSFSNSFKIISAGQYVFKPYFEQNGDWRLYNKGSASANNVVVNIPKYVADMQLVGDIKSTPANPLPGQAFDITYTIKNTGDKPAIYQRSVLQCRFNTRTNCDPDYNTPGLTIGVGEEKTFTDSFSPRGAGSYVFKPYFEQNNDWHLYETGTADANTLVVTVPNMFITSPITLNPSSPQPGQTAAITYTFKNLSSKSITYDTSVLQCRFNTQTNCDSSYGAKTTFSPGEEKTFSHAIKFSTPGTYRLVPYYKVSGIWHMYGINGSSQNELSVTIP